MDSDQTKIIAVLLVIVFVLSGIGLIYFPSLDQEMESEENILESDDSIIYKEFSFSYPELKKDCEIVEAFSSYQKIPSGSYVYATEVKIPYRGSYHIVSQGTSPLKVWHKRRN